MSRRGDAVDLEEHRRVMLAHCVALAQVDRAYAWWAAKRYAKESEGVLADLPQLLTEEMQRQKGAELQEANDADENEDREHRRRP